MTKQATNTSERRASPRKSTRARAMGWLHIAAQRRGLSHDDLRSLFGVNTLTVVVTDDLLAMALMLEEDRPTRGRRFPSAPRPLGPSVPAPSGPTSGASKRQRQYIRDLWHQLEYPPARLTAWLASHVGPVNLDEPHVCPYAATRAINQLLNALEKMARERGWYFRRTAWGHELDKRNRDPAAADYDVNHRGTEAQSRHQGNEAQRQCGTGSQPVNGLAES